LGYFRSVEALGWLKHPVWFKISRLTAFKHLIDFIGPEGKGLDDFQPMKSCVIFRFNQDKSIIQREELE
jgi:hypothetical protein